MADMSMEDIVAALSVLGVSDSAIAQRVASVSATPAQALNFLGRNPGEDLPPRRVNYSAVVCFTSPPPFPDNQIFKEHDPPVKARLRSYSSSLQHLH